MFGNNDLVVIVPEGEDAGTDSNEGCNNAYGDLQVVQDGSDHAGNAADNH